MVKFCSFFPVIDSERVTTRAEDPQGTPTQSHLSPSILVYAEKQAKGLQSVASLSGYPGKGLDLVLPSLPSGSTSWVSNPSFGTQLWNPACEPAIARLASPNQEREGFRRGFNTAERGFVDARTLRGGGSSRLQHC